MNFDSGVSAIEIKGRANKSDNPIHIRFNDGENEIKQVVTFPLSGKNITKMTFPLESFSGSGRINFIFMPGSDFDFISFQFKK